LTLPNSQANQVTAPSESKKGTENQRQYVRVYYPQDCPKKYLPELVIRYRAYQLLDISETGIRFLVPRMNLLPDDILTGVIKFLDESVIEFSGVVVRRTRDQIALKLIVGIPYSIISSEQVRLRSLEAEGEISFVKK
jgi:c-di-GMP-binding flagellar brake protein YcgR